jgi:hypothetical protein
VKEKMEKNLPAQKTEKEDEGQVSCKKMSLHKKSSVCNCFQEVMHLVRKISALHYATNMSWNLRWDGTASSSLRLSTHTEKLVGLSGPASIVHAWTQHACQEKVSKALRQD